jgi:hypothetical protein
VSPVHASQVAERHYEKPCPVCNKPVERDADHGVTFIRGEFRVFHDECAARLFGAAG